MYFPKWHVLIAEDISKTFSKLLWQIWKAFCALAFAKQILQVEERWCSEQKMFKQKVPEQKIWDQNFPGTPFSSLFTINWPQFKPIVALVVKSLDGKVAWVLNHQIFNERAYLAQSFWVYSWKQGRIPRCHWVWILEMQFRS